MQNAKKAVIPFSAHKWIELHIQ
uniref:Uncharacterized protein n=1 Tax=Anguilla anguilla TaxID=7936 RepID=A0A0E9TW41_ANGAN